MFPFEQFSLEMLVVFAIGLMVLGPKDLPVVMRKIGQFVAKMRGMAAEFRASFDELARQSELDELRKEVEALRTGAYTSNAPPPAPVHDYVPFDDAAAGLDSTGFSFPPQPSTSEPPVMGEGVPPAEAEVPLAAPPAGKPRRSRAKADAVIDEATAAEAAAAPKPARKPRAPKPAPADLAGSGVSAQARDAAE